MKSILLKTPGQFEYCEVDFNSQLIDNEVLIKIHKVGICGTDIHAYKYADMRSVFRLESAVPPSSRNVYEYE